MSIFPHYGNCKEEIAQLRKQVDLLQAQVVEYMNEITDLSCKYKMATLKCEKSCENKELDSGSETTIK